MKKHIANYITVSNLFFGCLALTFVFQGQYLYAFWMLFLAGVADFADGLVARRLGSDGALGTQLDSLADMVSFGVVPGAILYSFLMRSTDGQFMLAIPGFLITLFAALRLAKFNLLPDTSGDFIGLATPAATGFVAGLLLLDHMHPSFSNGILSNSLVLYAIIALLCWLMVSNISMLSFKFKGKQWSGNEWRYAFIILSILLLIFIQEWAFSALILIYILFSLIKHLKPSPADG